MSVFDLNYKKKKKKSIHSAYHTKQLPKVHLTETLGHAKFLFTFHSDVIRLIPQ